jgi:arylsulfatase A-like enzyme
MLTLRASFKKALGWVRCLSLAVAMGFLISPVLVAAETSPASSHPYNVLMIVIDDVSANLHSVRNKGPLKTPNIERIASRGTWFSHAYNDAPVCCASRTAMLTGVHSARSGVYYNTQPYRRSKTWIADAQTFPNAMLHRGYLTASFGKLVHNAFQEDNSADFTPGYYKMFDRKDNITHTDTALLDFILPGSKREIPGSSSRNWTWGILPDDWDRSDATKLQQDTEQSNRTIEFLKTKHDKPFFLSCGFWRPHVRWTVPQRYYDKFPLDQIELPVGYKPDDLEDLPGPGRWIAAHRHEHAEVVAGQMWKKSLQSYYASMTYIDEQIGHVLDALEKSPERDRTIVVFLSDNGMHLGEKDHWLKYALWEQTCQVFFSISVPGYPKQFSETPVGLIDLYPTLASLCDIPRPAHMLDGVDLKPLLAGKTNERGEPVLSTYGRGNHAIRDARYRYIRYRNGDEELYDHSNDPHEWTNLANKPESEKVKKRLRGWLPKSDTADVPEVANAKDNSRWSDEAFVPKK